MLMWFYKIIILNQYSLQLTLFASIEFPARTQSQIVHKTTNRWNKNTCTNNSAALHAAHTHTHTRINWVNYYSQQRACTTCIIYIWLLPIALCNNSTEITYTPTQQHVTTHTHTHVGISHMCLQTHTHTLLKAPRIIVADGNPRMWVSRSPDSPKSAKRQRARIFNSIII